MNSNSFIKARICNSSDSETISQCNDIVLQISPEEISKLQSTVIHDFLSLNIDYQMASLSFGTAFITVISLWLTSKGIGAIINMVRNF